MSKITCPYGLWTSPITPQSLAQGKRFADLAWDSDGQTLVWLEERSDRGVLVCLKDDGHAPRELNSELSVRAKVGYGGGDFTVSHGRVYFAEQSGRLYRQPVDCGPANPIIPPFGRAASPRVSPDGAWVVYVHSDEVTDLLAIVDAEGTQWPQKLVEGADFYMQPSWHPSGEWMAWIEWNHPHMPWDSARCVLARVIRSKGRTPTITESSVLAGDPDTSIFQPEFSPDGTLLAYISDQNGWGNLWIYDLTQRAHRCLIDEPVDLGIPAWMQGRRTFGFSHDGRSIFFLRNERGIRRLCAYDLALDTVRSFDHLSEYSSFNQIAASPTHPVIAFIGSSGTTPSRVVQYTPDHEFRICARATDESIAPNRFSQPTPIEWTSVEGATIHGIYYPPTNPDFEGRETPPAIIMIHGGPTGQRDTTFSAPNQFFATRGYAVLEVNYRGSTGYGKAYMKALTGNWGVYDVEDAIGGAQHLVDSGLAHPDRLVIMGGSAGGFTVLRALTLRPRFFKAGICLYGVSNLFTLDAETHKFESHYLETLLGSLPEASGVYRDRSPLFSANAIRDPIAIFQGDEDKIVPKDQAESLVAALKHHGVPHEYHVYSGEGHGWRKSETIAAFYTAVEAFLRRYVIFS